MIFEDKVLQVNGYYHFKLVVNIEFLAMKTDKFV